MSDAGLLRAFVDELVARGHARRRRLPRVALDAARAALRGERRVASGAARRARRRLLRAGHGAGPVAAGRGAGHVGDRGHEASGRRSSRRRTRGCRCWCSPPTGRPSCATGARRRRSTRTTSTGGRRSGSRSCRCSTAPGDAPRTCARSPDAPWRRRRRPGGAGPSQRPVPRAAAAGRAAGAVGRGSRGAVRDRRSRRGAARRRRDRRPRRPDRGRRARPHRRGPGRRPGLPDALAALARRAPAFPILADPLSGLRTGRPRPGLVIARADQLVAPGRLDRRPSPGVRHPTGAMPTSKPIGSAGADEPELS